MAKFRFTQPYASALGTWAAGDEAEFTADQASWVNRDVPGSLEAVDGEEIPDLSAPAPIDTTPDYDRILDRPAIVDVASLQEQERARHVAVAMAPPAVDLDVVANDGTHPAQQDAAPVIEAVITDAADEEAKLADAADDGKGEGYEIRKAREEAEQNAKEDAENAAKAEAEATAEAERKAAAEEAERAETGKQTRQVTSGKNRQATPDHDRAPEEPITKADHKAVKG